MLSDVITDTSGVIDVRRIEPAAQADFDHADVDLRSGEVQEAQRGHRFEPGNAFDRGDVRLQLVHQRGEGLARDRLVAHAHPLSKGVQVRRRVQRGPVTGRAQDRFDHRRGGAFAFGAGDMDRRVGSLRAAKSRQQVAHPIEAECLCRIDRRSLSFVIDEAVQVFERLRVSAHDVLEGDGMPARRASKVEL